MFLRGRFTNYLCCGCIVSWRYAQPSGSHDIGAARSRDAGYWPTEASPSLATIKAWNQRGAGIAWPTAKDTRCVGKEWWGLGKEWGGSGQIENRLLIGLSRMDCQWASTSGT